MTTAGEATAAGALAGAIDRVLPQTQCTKCGYAGCRPYAEAIASGETDINQCPPGGQTGIVKLAALLGRTPKPLDPKHGVEKLLCAALIDESLCIGCALCIEACPVDAIVGAPKQMHTVIVDQCTGCELCLPPCPVDCIAMVPAADPDWTSARADAARGRFEARCSRLGREQAESAALARAEASADAKRAAIAAAVERVKSKRAGTPALSDKDGKP